MGPTNSSGSAGIGNRHGLTRPARAAPTAFPGRRNYLTWPRLHLQQMRGGGPPGLIARFDAIRRKIMIAATCGRATCDHLEVAQRPQAHQPGKGAIRPQAAGIALLACQFVESVEHVEKLLQPPLPPYSSQQRFWYCSAMARVCTSTRLAGAG